MLAAGEATKAALRSLARGGAAELLPRGIRVSAVSPGATDTPSWAKAFPHKDRAAQLTGQMRETDPLKRLGTSEEGASAVLLLAFDATFATGAEFCRRGSVAALKAAPAECLTRLAGCGEPNHSPKVFRLLRRFMPD